MLFKLTKLKSMSALATEPSYDAYREARHGLGLGKLKNTHQVVQPDIAVLFASVQASAVPHHGFHSTTGIIEAVAKDFFDTDVAMSILDMNEEVERTGKKEHVVFLVVQKARRQIRGAKVNRPRDSENIQAKQEVLNVLCLQTTQFPNS